MCLFDGFMNMLQKLLAFWKGENIPLITFFAVLKLLLHIPFNHRYGFHADELLYLAMSENIDWGYKEGPPLIALLVWISGKLFGVSVWALRLMPTVCSAAIVFLTGIITKSLGGNKLAIIIACTAILASPSFLATAYMMHPVVFDQLFWVISVLLFIRYIQTTNYRLLLGLGFTIGLGMMNKFSIGLYITTLIAGLCFTPYRRLFFNRHALSAIAISLIVFLPHLLWQINKSFPVFTQLEELNSYYWSGTGYPDLFLQLFAAHGAAAAVWLAGLIFIFLSPEYKKYKFIGIGFILLQIILITIKGKTYYSFGAFPFLFAAGGVCFGLLLEKSGKPAMRYAFYYSLLLSGIIALPAVVPVFNLQHTILYFKYMKNYSGIKLPLKWDDGKYYQLTQYYGQMLGWEELAKKTSLIYNTLPLHHSSSTLILTDNYQQAGAIAYFGKKHAPQITILSGRPSFFANNNKLSNPDYMIVITKGNTNNITHSKLISQEEIKHPNAEIDGAKILLLRL